MNENSETLKALKMNENSETGYILAQKFLSQLKIQGFCGHLNVR